MTRHQKGTGNPLGKRNTTVDTTSDSKDQIRQAKAGCEISLGALLDHQRGYLQRIAGAAIDSDIRGQLSASDLVQETMMHAQVDFKNFQGEDSRQLAAGYVES